MLHANSPEFSRNLGFMSSEEQDILNNATVSIAGAGGDGGMLAVQLARLGVGNLRLADPDPFEAENINRQACCTQETIGVNKAVAVGDYIDKINPDIRVSLYTDGITAANVTEFTAGSDLVIDETEFTIQSLGVMIARQARQHNIPTLMAMNIGFGTTVTSFDPRGKSFESFLGLSEESSLEEIDESEEIKLSRWLAYLPPYADLDTFKKVASGEKSAPSVAPGVALAAGAASVQAFLHLVKGSNNRPDPIYAPKVMMMDAYTGESRIIRHPLLSHYKYFAKMLARNALKKIPKTSY